MSVILEDLQLTQDEELHERVRVWTYNYKYLVLVAILLLGLVYVPIHIAFKLILLPLILYYGFFSIRQLWRLSITNKRLVARRLYPFPFNFYFSRIKHFPFAHIEGISTGPRNNALIFLTGIFIGTNLGVNMLKTSLSTGALDLPDGLEFFIFVMKLTPFLQNDAYYLESELDDFYRGFARNFLLLLGALFIIMGVIMIFVSFPWKQYIVIRIRHGRDFRLRAYVTKKFVKESYSRLYNTKIVKAPKKYQKWGFPWLEGEKVEGVADLVQILYLTRIIGIFAIIAGSLRIWHGIEEYTKFSTIEFILWIFVALTDLFIAYLAAIFSTRSNEMVITNRRIIFAQEVRQISGVFGRKFFFISDLKRNDIASFQFRKVSAFAIEYLLAAIYTFYFALVVVFATGSLLVFPIIFIGILFLTFINQTFVSFSIKTKSGDRWVMRHQLANPVTRVRQFVGDEQSVLTRLLSNRLEEKEIINLAQKLRAGDLGMEPNNFEDLVNRDIRASRLNNEGITEVLTDSHFLKPRMFKGKRKSLKPNRRIQLSLDDLLLKDEKVVWEKIIPRPIRMKKLSFLVGSIGFLLFSPLITFIAFRTKISVFNETFEIREVNVLTLIFCIFIIIILYGVLIVKYYRLKKMSLVITKGRIFYEEIQRPPKWLFFFGIFRESYIRESVLTQLQNVVTGKYFFRRYGWIKYWEYVRKWLIWIVVFIFTLYFYFLTISSWKFLPGSGAISLLYEIFILVCAIQITWNAANAGIQFVQLWPSLELETFGIGVSYSLPYLNTNQAQNAQLIIWSGMALEEHLQRRRKRRRME